MSPVHWERYPTKATKPAASPGVNESFQIHAREFLAQMAGQELTAAEVAVLDKRTEGWIAGLQMAALSLRQRDAATVTQFIEEFSGSHPLWVGAEGVIKA